MKRTLYITAGLLVVGILFIVAVAAHNHRAAQTKASSQNTMTELQVVKTVDAHNLAIARDQLTAAQAQLETQKASLCTFIKNNTKPNIALPPSCQ